MLFIVDNSKETTFEFSQIVVTVIQFSLFMAHV